MATVQALTGFKGWLKRDELGPRPKVTKGDRKGKEAGEEEGFAPGLPAKDQFGDPIQDVKLGEYIQIHEGQLLDSSHPAVKKWPAMFGQPTLAESRTEQATRAPGEIRK